MKTSNDYEKQALYFAKKYGVKLQILGSEYKTMWGEEQKRWVFKCKLSRNSKSYNFEFIRSEEGYFSFKFHIVIKVDIQVLEHDHHVLTKLEVIQNLNDAISAFNVFALLQGPAG